MLQLHRVGNVCHFCQTLIVVWHAIIIIIIIINPAVERIDSRLQCSSASWLRCWWGGRSFQLLLQPFNGLFSRTTWVSRYQKGTTNLDFTGARDSEWQWHQLGHMQVYTSLQTDNHASTPPLCFLQAGCPSCRMPFLPPNQQRQSTEGHSSYFCIIL